MGYTYYTTKVLIPEGYVLTFAELADKLQKRFARSSEMKIEVSSTNKIVLHHGEWFLSIYWEDEPLVAVESEEIARLLPPEHPERPVIAACSRRITTAGEADPNMVYFNDYIFVLEVLEGMPGLFTFDYYSGQFKKTVENGEPTPL